MTHCSFHRIRAGITTMDTHSTPEARLEVDGLREAHSVLLARYAALERAHSELQGLYAEAIAEKERSVEENQKLWSRFKSSPKKSRQNSAGSSTSIPVRAGMGAGAGAGVDRLDAATPPNLYAPTGNPSHSPLANSTLDDGRFVTPASTRATKPAPPIPDTITPPTLPLFIHPPVDET